MIEQVRLRVLQLVSEQPAHLFDDQDVDSHIRSRDGLIRMFVEQFVEDRKSHDVEAISQRMIETLKWRKSSGLTTLKESDFPLEFWTRNHFQIFEDDDILIGVYDLSSFKKISSKWNDVMQQFYQYVHNRYCLEAVHAGKRVIMITDGSKALVENVNTKLDANNMSTLDTHFPCMSDKIGIFGVSWVISCMGAPFIKFCLPYSMKKRFKIYTGDTIKEVFDPDHLPIQFGGKLALQPLIDVHEVKGLKTLREYGEDHGFQEWEMDRMIQYYKS